jgi:hypothetical protein
MNAANVAALKKLILVWENDGIDTKHGGYPDLSEWLDSQGVLVPSALTDVQAQAVADTPSGYAREVRAALERIAKGD